MRSYRQESNKAEPRSAVDGGIDKGRVMTGNFGAVRLRDFGKEKKSMKKGGK